jgi:hypothetical protein
MVAVVVVLGPLALVGVLAMAALEVLGPAEPVDRVLLPPQPHRGRAASRASANQRLIRPSIESSPADQPR